MKVVFGLLLSMLWMGTLTAQVEFFVPDARWSEASQAYIGLVNPGRADLELTLTGYAADGAALGSVTRTLGRYGRLEEGSAALFGASIAWIKISGSATVNGYVRYDQSGKMSLTALSPGPGGVVYNPQIDVTGQGYAPATVIVNAVDGDGGAQLQPIVRNGFSGSLSKTAAAGIVPDFGLAHQQTTLDYSLYTVSANKPVWDAVTATGSAGLIGMQHFAAEAGSGAGAVTFPRTPPRALYFPALQPYDKKEFWSKLVLINVYPVSLPFVMEAFFDLDVVQSTEYVLDPYETMVIDIEKQTDFWANANWIRVLPYDPGLVGYMMMGDDAGKALATTNGNYVPQDGASFSYTPTTDSLNTTIGLVNAGENTITPFFAGLNDAGRVVAYASRSLQPRSKRDYSMTQLFGDKAEQVTWAWVFATRAEIAAYALVSASDGSTMAAYDGMPFSSHRGQFFNQDFEFFQAIELEGRGWQTMAFPGSPHPRRLSTYLNQAQAHTSDDPQPGEFFVEHAFYEHGGDTYLAYEPAARKSGLNSVAFMSPFIEVPDFVQPYLTFEMRMIRPEEADEDSRFGVVWREEGSSEWTWVGFVGETLLNPDTNISDCWIDIQYRNDFIALTGYYQFEHQLPESVRGKRIQVGYYYHHPADSNGRNPLLFVDHIRLTGESNKEGLIFRNSFYGGGTFTYDENAQPTVE